MNALLQNLLKLQSLEFGESSEKNAKTTITELRGKIPKPILDHYDRLRARGKKGVGLVRNQVCTGCHMRVPIGMITTLMHNLDIQLCDNCGRYLYLSPEAGVEFSERSTVPKPAEKKPRKRKAASQAAA